ncbi:hypothetical protein EBU24_02475 [bacterium]|nr:hypothetical protein [bacterium]
MGPFAEVIESSLQGWTAQCWQWNKVPAFGSLVMIKTSHRILFGIVYQSQTGSLDGNRYPFAYKKTHEELLQEQPHIFDFLRTTFSCLLVGFIDNNSSHSIIYRTAPEPAPIHSFIETIDKLYLEQFFKSEQYLHLIFGASDICKVDELLLALLSIIQSNKTLYPTALSLFLDTFSVLIGNDYRRLKLFLQRVESYSQA